MLRNLCALGAFALLGLTGVWAGRALRRAVGRSRLGRLAAALAPPVGYGLGAAILLVLWNGGRHRAPFPRTPGDWVQWEWPTALAVAGLLAVLVGVTGFVRGERRGEVPLPDGREAEFPPSYVRDILEAEGRATKLECRQLAAYLAKRSRKSGQPLPPELAEFTRRHLGRHPDRAT